MDATLTNAMVRCLLVIPCFRESERLPKFLPALVRAVEASGLDVRIRAVDDGSGAGEQAWLRDYVAGLAAAHGCVDPAQLNERNTGKGGAVYSGWERAEGAAVLAFVDADGAVPPEEVVRLLRMAVEDSEGAVIAVRTGELGTRVVREMKRRVAGQVFRWIVRWHFGFPVPDTQCGCKAVPGAVFAEILPELTERRFTFDVELLWHLFRRGVRVRSVPIDWEESPGSRLQPGSALAMFRSLRALRRKLGDWGIGI